MTSTLFTSAILAIIALSNVAPAQVQTVQSFPLNQYVRVLEGQWEGIRYASDGNVYFASSTHSARHGAAFFKYNPQTAQITMLTEDITRICGEDPLTNPQGKIHSDIVEANGWLYFSTHFSSEDPRAYAHWTGSHLIGYQMATGRFRDFGVIHPNYTSYSAIAADPVRNYVYVFVTGQNTGQVSYLYRFDALTGTKTNLGQVGSNFNSSFYMFLDQRGDGWFSLASQGGSLFRVVGATGQIQKFANVLPPLYRTDTELPDESQTAQSNRWIFWMQPLDGNRAVFTVGWYGGMLFEFDSSKPIGSGQEFRKIKHIGYSDIAAALGRNRVYYLQRANRQAGNQGFHDFHLMSVPLDWPSDPPIYDHGLLQDQDGRTVWRLPSMMTDARFGTGNRLFATGDWWTVPGDLGSLRYNYNNGAEKYDPLPRGQFFVTATPGEGTPIVAAQALNLAASSTIGGSQVGGNRVTLSGSVGQATVIHLWSSHPTAASVPQTVSIPAGASVSDAFSVVTSSVTSPIAITISASYAGSTKTMLLNVRPRPALSSLTLGAASITAGQSLPGNAVTLNTTAPPGGILVSLSSSRTATATVPASILVPEGETTAAFNVATAPLVVEDTAVGITASYGGINRSATLNVLLSAAGFSVSGTPATVMPGEPVTASWTAPPGRPTSDWVGLFRPGTPNTGQLTYAYTAAATTGSKVFKAPTQPGEYEFRYLLKGSTKDIARSGVVTVSGTVPTPPALTITNVQATSITAMTATITWKTSVPANSQCEFGTSAAYGSLTPLDASFVTTHSCNLTGLAPGTQHYFRVRSRDASANLALSPGSSFSTLPEPGYALVAAPGTVAPGAPITLNVTRPAGGSAKDWVGLFLTGSADTSWIWRQTVATIAAATLTVPAPVTPGQYEFRYLHSNGGPPVARSNALTVATSAYSLGVTPTLAAPSSGRFSVTWNAPSGRPASDWVGLFQQGAANNAYKDYKFTGGALSGTLIFNAPSQPGLYEFRYLLNNGYTETARSVVVEVR